MTLGARRYAQTQIQTSSSLQVVVLLYDGTIQAMKLAKEGILANNYHDKARFIDRALRVVGELSAALDMEKGGGIATDLRRLYDYIQHELTQANLHHDSSRLEGPIRCLSTLREAWQDLVRQRMEGQAVGA